MPPSTTPIPAPILASVAVSTEALEALLGRTVVEFCGHYGTVGDTLNHCAHFVSHVMGFRVPGAALCSNVAGSTYRYEERMDGFCIRVNQVFNSLQNRMLWDDATTNGKYIVVATIEANLTDRAQCLIGEMSRKHIGFFVDGNVYHYSNTKDQVVKQTIPEFRRHYGVSTLLLRADLP